MDRFTFTPFSLYLLASRLGVLLLILNVVLGFGLALSRGLFGKKLQWET